MIPEAVGLFWRLTGGQPPPFPRDLAPLIPLALPLTIIEMSGLSCSRIDGHLAAMGGAAALLCRDRSLRGCLVAVRGEGAIFLDADDPPPERRFTLAHEVGHFLLDYHLPRARALRALGEEVRPVLDGERPPTHGERVHSVLSRVPIGPHINLMGRATMGDAVSESVLVSEAGADRLALELLAPWDDVAARLAPGGVPIPAFRERAAALLRGEFGLPPRIAVQYAARLQAQLRPETVRDRLALT